MPVRHSRARDTLAHAAYPADPQLDQRVTRSFGWDRRLTLNHLKMLHRTASSVLDAGHAPRSRCASAASPVRGQRAK